MKINRELQLASLNLLDKFIEICENNGLRYYFTGGSLIGVLRHKGYIPWDDDIDIAMPRTDYEKFLEIITNYTDNTVGLINHINDSNWYFAFSQFIDYRTEIEISIAEEKRRSFLWLDIFPLDGLPNNIFLRWFRVKQILFYRYIIQLSHINTQVDINRTRPLIEKAILKFFKIFPIFKFVNTKCFLKKLEVVLRKSNFDESRFAGNMLGRYREKEVVPKKYFGTPVKAEFEGRWVNIPEMSHELQTALYGDYMKLPPIEMQIAHNVKLINRRNTL